VYAGGEGVGFVVRVAVALAVVQIFHQLGGGVAQVHGHRAGPVFLDEGLDRVERFVDRVGFGRHSQVHHAFGQRQFTLGRAQTFIDLGGVQR
jgi:hypothetical protein